MGTKKLRNCIKDSLFFVNPNCCYYTKKSKNIFAG